jgi:hypothetical protein
MKTNYEEGFLCGWLDASLGRGVVVHCQVAQREGFWTGYLDGQRAFRCDPARRGAAP